MGAAAIINAAFSNARVAMLALVLLCGIGLVAFNTVPREGDPDIPLPFVQVVLPLPGISPEDAERLLIRPAELELQSLEGLVQMDATAFENVAHIRLEFEPGLDMDDVVTDVREAIDRARAEFPDAAQEPIIEEVNAQSLFPILTVVLSGDAPEHALFEAMRELDDRLTGLPGVREVTPVGDREEVVEVVLSPAALELHRLSPLEVANAIRRNNALVTAGTLQFSDANYSVKVPGLLKSLDEMREIPVRADETALVTLGDVATIRRTFEDSDGFARFNGRPAMGLDISKRAEANLIDVTDAVIAEANAVAAAWPATIEVAYIGAMSAQVESIFSSLTSSIGLAIILVMIVVVAALGLRSAVLVGFAIPASFMIGIGLIGLMGYTLNSLVMFSLVLAVGMLVDAAIVLMEYADRRIDEGYSRSDAYRAAATKMFWPITASTATTLAAFIPFLFWNDVEGYFMRWIPITLIMVLSASVMVSLIFLPIIGANFGLPRALQRFTGARRRPERSNSVDLDHVDPTQLSGTAGTYARLLSQLVQMPVVVTIGAIVVIMICGRLFAVAKPEVEQFLRVDSEQVLVMVQGRGNMSTDEILDVAMEVQDRIKDHPAIEYAYLQTGPHVSQGRDATVDSIALISLDLLPYQERDHSLVVTEELRALAQGVPGVRLEVRQPEQGPLVGKDVQLELRATDFAAAEAAAAEIRAFLESDSVVINGRDVPTFMDVEDSGALPGVEWAMQVDRGEAGRYGLGIADVGAVLQLGTEGLIVDTYRPDDSDTEIDIRVRFAAADRSLGLLEQINVPTPQGNVPLANFTTRTAQPKLDRITRRDGHRIIDVKANANTTVPGFEVSQDRATAELQAFIDAGGLASAADRGVVWELHGAAEERNESSAFFGQAMIAAMFMIGVILLLQFNNFYHVVLTLSAVVLSVYGVLAGIALSGQYVSVIMTGVGIVALAGIVVNNNIVLIDAFHTLRGQGLGIVDAAIRTGAQRFRPVLLTTGTTIIGLLPMVFEINIDFGAARLGIGNETSDWWVLLSSAIVFGLGFSTLLTLILTPVWLAAPHVLAARFGRLTAPVRERVERWLDARDAVAAAAAASPLPEAMAEHPAPAVPAEAPLRGAAE